jgi:glucose-6-phosphate 1-dehydrogenase
MPNGRWWSPVRIVIFGASGDLTARKFIPALYHLFKDNQLPPDFRIVGFARREKTDASFRAELREALEKFSRTQPVDDALLGQVRRAYCLLHGRFDRPRRLSKAGTASGFLWVAQSAQ